MFEKIKKGDWLIISFLMIIMISSSFLVMQHGLSGMRRITVEIAGEKTSYRMDPNRVEVISFLVKGESAILQYDKGRIRMQPMSFNSCPQQICSKTGWIDSSWEAIICLPNQMMITIDGEGGLDATAS